jgi:hypothetical protein
VSDLRADVLLDALRPLVAELVAEELALREREDDRATEAEYLTTAEYAVRFKTTPGAVLARIHRGTLRAIRPPGAREWLIPIGGFADDGG